MARWYDLPVSQYEESVGRCGINAQTIYMLSRFCLPRPTLSSQYVSSRLTSLLTCQLSTALCPSFKRISKLCDAPSDTIA